MTVKQLAERIGVLPKQLNFELMKPCCECKRMGGTEELCPHKRSCYEVAVVVRVQE